MSSTSAYHTKYTINKYQVPLIVYWFDDTCKSKKCECVCVYVYVCECGVTISKYCVTRNDSDWVSMIQCT